MSIKKKICFYARVPDINLLNLVNFYSNDIKILRELGHEVLLSNNYKNIPFGCDIYFIWWWSSGIVPLIRAKIQFKPSIMIGNIHFRDQSTAGYKYRPFYIKQFVKYCLRNSDIQIATSKIELDDIKLFKAKNPVLIYHTIDENKFKFYNGPREKYLLAITRLLKLNIERKKIIESIEAFDIVLKKFPEYKFLIAGRKEDDGYSYLSNKIKLMNLSDKVILLGNVSEEDKINYLQKCSVYVQPTSYEGFGMAIGESMLCGTPVVTSPNGAVPEVAGELAVYVNPDDPSEIANGIIKILTDKSLRDNLSIEGSLRIKNLFSYEKRKNAIKDLIDLF